MEAFNNAATSSSQSFLFVFSELVDVSAAVRPRPVGSSQLMSLLNLLLQMVTSRQRAS